MSETENFQVKQQLTYPRQGYYSIVDEHFIFVAGFIDVV